MTEKKNYDIIIVGAGGDGGEEMAYYLKGVLLATVEIDGSREMQESLTDYCGEFSLTLEEAGITSIKQADEGDYGTTERRPYVDFEGMSKEEIARMAAAGELDEEDDFYVFPEKMDDIPAFKKLVEAALI